MRDVIMKLSGVVKRYSGMGRKLGYPTANIEIDLHTKEGLYVGYTYLEGKKLPSIIYIGAPETFGEEDKRAESYILDFKDRDLYGEKIILETTAKLRKNRPFESADALIAQMKKDEKNARKFFNSLL